MGSLMSMRMAMSRMAGMARMTVMAMVSITSMITAGVSDMTTGIHSNFTMIIFVFSCHFCSGTRWAPENKSISYVSMSPV